MFKKMYCHKNLDLSINEAVNQMSNDKIDYAMTQTERTVEKNKTSSLSKSLTKEGVIFVCPCCGSDKVYKTDVIHCDRCAVTTEI